MARGARGRCPCLSRGFSSLGAEFIEQPFPDAHDRDLIRGSYPIPIIADESCVLEEDVDRLYLNFDGVNVKLVKCGGSRPHCAWFSARARSLCARKPSFDPLRSLIHGKFPAARHWS